MEEPSKADAKTALREKNRISAKEFIKMKRGQAKEEKNSSESFEKARGFISQGQDAKLDEFLATNKPEFILNFLFSEDEMKQTPLALMLKGKECMRLLRVANSWSVRNSDLIVREIYMETNEFKNNHFRVKFQSINKTVMELLDQRIVQGEPLSEVISLLGEKDTIFYHLCKNFLSLEMIITTVASLKTKNNLLTAYYVPLLAGTDLRELVELGEQVKGYQAILMRDKLWSKVDCSILREVTMENFELLTLKEIKHNIWHELANNNPAELLKLCELVSGLNEENEELHEKYLEMLLEIDSSGESVSDKCLRLWSSDQLAGFFELGRKVDNIMLSTNCLNKLFYNRKLRQADRERLISECLEGEISTKGYIKIIPNHRERQVEGMRFVVQVKPLKYTYNICYDKGELKRQRDSAGSYPLITYLKLYKATAKLKTVQHLYLQFLNRKEIKKKLSILLKVTDQKRILVDENSGKKDEIQFLFNYFQPLWKAMTVLPHGEVLEYLLSKTYTNSYEIKLFKTANGLEAELGGRHYLVYYFENSPFLGEDAINRQLIDSLVKCKISEKLIGRYNLDIELVRSLNSRESFHTSSDYFTVALRSYLKAQLVNLDFDKYMHVDESWDLKVLLDVICDPLANSKPSLLDRSEILKKCDPEVLKNDYEISVKYFLKEKLALKNFYKNVLVQLKIQMPEEEELFDYAAISHLIQEFYSLQQAYHSFSKPSSRKKSFFDGLKNWLNSHVDFQLARESVKHKFYCFRLRPDESHLTYKFKRLLQLGIDPYFCKHSRFNLDFQEEDAEWSKIMIRMLKDKKTFIGALITSPTSNIDSFRSVIESNLTVNQLNKEWMRLSLIRKIENYIKTYTRQSVQAVEQKQTLKATQSHYFKAPMYIVEGYLSGLNLEVIMSIFRLGTNHCLQKTEIAPILRFVFKRIIREISIQLKDNQMKLERAKSNQKAIIKQQIQSLEAKLKSFVDQWLPEVKAPSSNEASEFDTIQGYLKGLLKYAYDQDNEFLGECLLKHIEFERVSDSIYVVAKLVHSQDPGQILNVYLMSLPDEALSTWIKTLHPWRRRITQIAKQFSLDNQISILTHLLERIQTNEATIQHGEVQQVKLVCKNFVMWANILVKVILSSFHNDYFPNALKVIKDSSVSVKEKASFYRFLLRTVQDADSKALELIVMDVGYFYLRQQNNVYKRFHMSNFYAKCDSQTYSVYLKNLKSHHELSLNIGRHIKNTVNCLYEAEDWQRLRQLQLIEATARYYVPLLMKALPTVQIRLQILLRTSDNTIVTALFDYLKDKDYQQDEDLFVAAFKVDQTRVFSVLKPKVLSIYGFRQIIRSRFYYSPLLRENGVELNMDYLPTDISPLQAKRYKHWFPMWFHNPNLIEQYGWLLDELLIELSLASKLQGVSALMFNTLKVMCTSEKALEYKDEMYNGVLSDKEICEHLVRCNWLKSWTQYEKYIPDLSKITKEIVFKGSLKKGQCMNLNVLNPMHLKELIENKFLSSDEPKIQYSCFLRLVDTTNLYLLELFTKTNKITINTEYLGKIHGFFGFDFWDHLLGICNQDFIVGFITKYKLFEIYNVEDYSERLLNFICRYRYNRLLQFTIKYLENKFKAKAVFVAEKQNNKPSISSTATFFMPIQQSIDSNFYETYFLIKNCNNQCPKFLLSARFLTEKNSDEWNYIPDLKRRVEINNIFMKTLREAQEMEFRFKVLLPSIFELLEPVKSGPVQQQQPPSQDKLKKGNTPQLAKFIHDITKKCLSLTWESGIYEKLYFLILKSGETKIPEAQLQKRYPPQMKIINSIRKYIDNQSIQEISLDELFDHVPQFKSQLLIYNPEAYLSNQEYVDEIMGMGDKKLDFSQYLPGIQINFIQFQSKHGEVLQNYINEYFFNSSISLGNPDASLHLTREALLLLFLDISHHERNWEQCTIFNLCKRCVPFEPHIYQQMCETEERVERAPEQVLYDLSMCLNIRGQNTMSFDLMVWNKIIKQVQDIQALWTRFGTGKLQNYSLDQAEINKIATKYAETASFKLRRYRISNLKEIICQVYDEQLKNCSKKGVFIELSLLINLFLISSDLKTLEQKIQALQGGKNITRINAKLTKDAAQGVIFESPEEITIQISYSIQPHESGQIMLFLIDYSARLINIQHSLIYCNLVTSPKVKILDEFCGKAERMPFFKNYRFSYKAESFKACGQQYLSNLLKEIKRIPEELQKMQDKLVGTKNIKVYSLSDIYGPINFSQENDDQKILDCLGFYQLIELPKQDEVKVSYLDPLPLIEKNSREIKHIRNYLKYYIATSKDQNVGKVDMENEIVISTQYWNIQWERFGAWAICELYCLTLNYCSDLSRKIDRVLDVRVSFSSLINYYEKSLECGNQFDLKMAIESLLQQKYFKGLVEGIILMITEDVGNIMKIVKGIIIKWTINKKDSKKRAKLMISHFVNAQSVEYEVKDQLLNIVINLEMEKGLNSLEALKNNQDCNVLVDRKEFLDSVFTSAQFLADYFIMRNQLNNECLRISTSITNKLNTTINFHIEYSNLYAYVQKMRNSKTIKDIESFLIRLKQYLSHSMDKTINLYLNSQELANKHQVFILNKCEAINKSLPLSAIQSQKQLIYDSLESDPPNGLTEVTSLMNEIGNDENIKNVFLIQIYKSYYTTMVGEGMTFVVGYKSNKKKSQVIKITKAENINLINIVELDFIMLVSKNIPTNDELNQSKIIRLFITDSNKNLYLLNEKIKGYFLSLPEQNEERNLAYFAPLVSSNIMLKFSLEGKREPDTKEMKIFFIDLNESAKFKLAPNLQQPLTPLNSCKKNLEFKQSLLELQKGFKTFYQTSMKFIIDLPEQFTQKFLSTNFSHIIHLVSTDLLQFLLKFEFEPMRNEELDCKLSVQKKFILNKNSIIQLRKRLFMKHYNNIRIKVRDNSSGITFDKNEIIICIDVTNMTTLPSSTEYLSTFIFNILNNQKRSAQEYIQFAESDKNESTEVLLKELDIINYAPYQIEEIKEAINLIHLLYKKTFTKFKILIFRKKSQIRFDTNYIELSLNVESVERQFFSAEQIIRSYIASVNKNFEPNIKGRTYFNPLKQQIITEQCSVEPFRLVFKGLDSKWSIENVNSLAQAFVSVKTRCQIPSRYFLLQSENVYSNFFFNIDKNLAITQKNSEGTRCNSKYLYLESSKAINLNFTNIFVTETNPLFKQITNTFNILRSPIQKNKITVQLISKNMYLIIINYDESMILNINYGGNFNIFNPELEKTNLVISSDGQLCLDNTKFIELEAYKKKPVLIKDKQYENKNSQFKQFNERASNKDLELKLGDKNNIENQVYVVNDECKKYLTRAGEPRVDYIQLCDNDGNPIDYKQKLDVMFVHINRLDIVRPEIEPRNLQLGLRWIPTIRGHYYLYINFNRINPPYEIGVCAAQADYRTTIVTVPKIKKICYCEESQLMLDLRDNFGNLYTQLEEDILGDSLLIELRCSQFSQYLKLQKSQINKYGLKKVKFSFNNTDQDKQAEIEVAVFLNCQEIAKFVLVMEGLSLKQRKKLLDKDISLNSKNYYKDITINRNRFLQDLFVVAEKSLHTNLSVRFVNEPGIDAGGVKRQFYDMIGNEIKNERNPFFIVNRLLIEQLNEDGRE